MIDNPTEASNLEMAEQAHMAARYAWLFPSDHEFRQLAVEACYEIGVDYIEACARIMEARPDADMERAQRHMAEALRTTADGLYHAGTLPREGIIVGEQSDVPDAPPEWLEG